MNSLLEDDKKVN